jgi:hypothetical protein
LLRQNVSDAELQSLWNAAGSNYHVVGKSGQGGVRTLLTMVKDQIE